MSSIPPLPPVPPRPSQPGSPPPPPPAPLSPAAPAPKPPREPVSKRTKIIAALSIVAAAGAVAAAVIMVQRNRVPSSAAVREFVERSMPVSIYQLKSLATQATRTSDAHAQVIYQAGLELTEAVYVPINTDRFAAERLDLDPRVLQAIRKITSSKHGPAILEAAGLSRSAVPFSKVVILHETHAKASPFAAEGQLKATRFDDGWHFEPQGGQWPQPDGQPKGGFKGDVFLENDPNDLARLKALAQDEKDALSRLESAQTAVEDKIRREIEKVASDLFSPGLLYSGVASSNNGESVKLFIEIKTHDLATGHFGAVLRNDGGWADFRSFRGSYVVDEADHTAKVVLSTSSDKAVKDAGPFLQNEETYQLTLTADRRQLTGTNQSGAWQYSFQRLSPEDAKAQREEIEQFGASLLAATKPGTIYAGTAVSKDLRTSVAYLLTFDQQESGGALIRATLSDPHRPDLQRPFSGTIITNRYKAGNSPIRLQSKAGDAVNPFSDYPLNDRMNYYTHRIYLRFDDGKLVGDGEHFNFTFNPAASDLVNGIRDRIDAQKKFVIASVQPGTVLDGYVMSADKRYTDRVRLRFTGIEQEGARVEATLQSLDVPEVQVSLSGTLDVNASVLRLTSPKGRNVANGSLRSPILTHNYLEHTMELMINPGGVEGSLLNEDWRFHFDLPSTTQPPSADGINVVPNPSQASADSNGYPTAEGTYAWSNGSWLLLPRNNGHVAYTLNSLLNGLNPNGRVKLADLSFDGADPIPAVDASSLRIVYVGSISPIPPVLLNRYPELRDYPVIEIAPTSRHTNGVRSAGLFRIVPGFSGFCDTRVRASVEKAGDNVWVVTCSQPLAPGSYAIAAGANAFEVMVR